MGDSNSTPADTTSTPTEETSGQPGRPTSPHSKLRFQCKLARLANRRKDVCFKSCKKSQKNCDFFVIFAPETCDFRNGLITSMAISSMPSSCSMLIACFLLMATSTNATVCCCSGIVYPTSQCYDDAAHCSFTDKCGSTKHLSNSDNKVPKWSPTYNMSESTVMMPCNYSGLYDFDAYPKLAKFGLVDYDW